MGRTMPERLMAASNDCLRAACAVYSRSLGEVHREALCWMYRWPLLPFWLLWLAVAVGFAIRTITLAVLIRVGVSEPRLPVAFDTGDYVDVTARINRRIAIRTTAGAELTLADLHEMYQSGLYYRVYRRAQPLHYVVAFRGTEPISVLDWSADLLQLFGQSRQYYLAVIVARLMEEHFGRRTVTFTGHSLGGGLANLAGLVTGADVFCFNAAGLNRRTLDGVETDLVPLLPAFDCLVYETPRGLWQRLFHNVLLSIPLLNRTLIRSESIDFSAVADGLTIGSADRVSHTNVQGGLLTDHNDFQDATTIGGRQMGSLYWIKQEVRMSSWIIAANALFARGYLRGRQEINPGRAIGLESATKHICHVLYFHFFGSG